MRIDWYTKGVLTVIAILLAMVVLKQYVSPETVVQAQGAFAGVQFAQSAGYPYFFDTRTGEIFGYSVPGVFQKYRLTKLGSPLVVEK